MILMLSSIIAERCTVEDKQIEEITLRIISPLVMNHISASASIFGKIIELKASETGRQNNVA